jgi:hypothetical protein
MNVSLKQVIFSIAFVVTLCWTSMAANAEMLNYAVGNSLTWDMLLAGGFDSTTVAETDKSSTAYQINCGASLSRTYANPNEACVPLTSYGNYVNGLAQPLDNVFLQPFPGSTVRQEVDSIKSLIDYTRMNPANADTRFFVYAGWGDRVNSANQDFLTVWNTHTATLNGSFVASESTYDLIMSTLKAEGYANVDIIGAGHSFAAVAEALKDGVSIGGLTSVDDLYRDGLHASNAGKYIAAISAFAAVYGKDPSGQTMANFPFTLPGYGTQLNADGVQAVQEIVWQTRNSIVAVPEPGTMLTLGAALSGLLVRNIRKRRKTA